MRLQYNTELYHFGIKGMRWGIRRYQNPNGTLTEAGRKRYLRYLDKYDADEIADRQRTKKEVAELMGYDGRAIRKGTKMYRVATQSDKVDDRRKYVSIDENDVGDYVEAAFEGLIAPNASDTDELRIFTYEAKTDIKVASIQQQWDYIYDKLGDVKVRDLSFNYSAPALDAFREKHGDTTIRELRSDIEFVASHPIINTGKPSNEFKQYANYAATLDTISRAFRYQKLFTKSSNDVISDRHYEMQEHFKKLGYQALVDIEDANISTYPMILLSPKDTVKQLSSGKI